MANSSTALTVSREKLTHLQAFFDNGRDRLMKICGDDLAVNRLIVAAMMKAAEEPKILSCEPRSIFRSVCEAALVGADLAANRGDGYLIPYGKICTFIDGYQLWARKAAEAGYRVVAAPVHGEEAEMDGGWLKVTGGDHFEYREIPLEVTYTPNPMAADRRRLFGFAAAYRGGAELVHAVIVPAPDIEKAGKNSRSPAWKEWPDRMWRRLPIKRLCRDLDLSSGPGLARLIELDNHREQGARYHPVIDADEALEPLPDNTLDEGTHTEGFGEGLDDLGADDARDM